MPRRIEETVAKNRSGRKKLEGYAISVNSDATRDYVFTGTTVEMQVSLEVYTRPLNDTLILGHPDPSQGMGRGSLGDHRGEWELVTDETESGQFTKAGRGTVVDAIEGARDGLLALAVGAGSGAAGTGDQELDDETGSGFAYGLRESKGVTRSRGSLRFHEYGETVSEFGVENVDGDLTCRLTTETVDPALDEELRVDVMFEFQGDSIGNAVVTEDGEEMLAKSIRIPSERDGLYVAIGEGTDIPDRSDTELQEEIAQKRAARDAGNETVRAYTKWYKNEPDEQPVDVSEIGVLDNDGNLAWATTFDPFEKTDSFPVRTGAQIRII